MAGATMVIDPNASAMYGGAPSGTVMLGGRQAGPFQTVAAPQDADSSPETYGRTIVGGQMQANPFQTVAQPNSQTVIGTRMSAAPPPTIPRADVSGGSVSVQGPVHQRTVIGLDGQQSGSGIYPQGSVQQTVIQQPQPTVMQSSSYTGNYTPPMPVGGFEKFGGPPRPEDVEMMEPEYFERVVEVPKIAVEIVEKVQEVPVPVIQDRIVEIPQIQEVIKQVPRYEVQHITREVPKIEVQQVERTVEVPQITVKDRYVEVPQIKEVVRKVPRIQVHEIPIERIIQVPKKVIQEIEQPVYRPMPQPVNVPVERVIPVPRVQVQTVEVVKQVPIPTIVDVEVDVPEYEPQYIDIEPQRPTSRPPPPQPQVVVQPPQPQVVMAPPQPQVVMAPPPKQMVQTVVQTPPTPPATMSVQMVEVARPQTTVVPSPRQVIQQRPQTTVVASPRQGGSGTYATYATPPMPVATTSQVIQSQPAVSTSYATGAQSYTTSSQEVDGWQVYSSAPTQYQGGTTQVFSGAPPATYSGAPPATYSSAPAAAYRSAPPPTGGSVTVTGGSAQYRSASPVTGGSASLKHGDVLYGKPRPKGTPKPADEVNTPWDPRLVGGTGVPSSYGPISSTPPMGFGGLAMEGPP